MLPVSVFLRWGALATCLGCVFGVSGFTLECSVFVILTDTVLNFWLVMLFGVHYSGWKPHLGCEWLLVVSACVNSHLVYLSC